MYLWQKNLGYTPNSPRSPLADLSVVVNNATGSTLTMPAGTKFQTTVDNLTYNFVTIDSNTISPVNGVYTFSNVKFMKAHMLHINIQQTLQI